MTRRLVWRTKRGNRARRRGREMRSGRQVWDGRAVQEDVGVNVGLYRYIESRRIDEVDAVPQCLSERDSLVVIYKLLGCEIRYHSKLTIRNSGLRGL